MFPLHSENGQWADNCRGKVGHKTLHRLQFRSSSITICVMYNQGPARGPAHQLNQLPPLGTSSNSHPIGHQRTWFTSASTSYTPGFNNSYGPNQLQLQAHVPGGSSYQTLGHNLVPSIHQTRPHRCTRAGCSFSSHSKMDLENHMMDRHFIFPPGWNERKGPKQDGDAASLVLILIMSFLLPEPTR